MKSFWITLGSTATLALLAGCGGGGDDGGGGNAGIAGGGGSSQNAFVQAVDQVIRTPNAEAIEPVDATAAVATQDDTVEPEPLT
jgi:hypothetical protein